jgi:SAM-dependent methyltransferase
LPVATIARRLGIGRSSAEELDRLRRRVRKLEKQNRRLRARNELLSADTTAVQEVPGVSRLELRRGCVLASSPAAPSVLEIGPAHNAILPRRDGYRTRTVDYLDRAGLIERYAHFEQYSPDDIEDVDFVLAPGAAMADVIPDRFDLVVASHVLEHTTSMIDFLNECARLLAPGGVLALVVPDHRYCFDRFRERSALGRVIDAALDPPAVHTVGTVTEERLNACRHRRQSAWMPHVSGRYTFENDLKRVAAYASAAREKARYVDSHNWVCTPHHLRLLLDDLHTLGYVDLRETFFHDTVRHEFFVNLSAEGPGPGLSREELVVLSDQERRSTDRPVFRPTEADDPA